MLKKFCQRYLVRLKKVIDLGGARLEPEHLKQLRKREKENYKWVKPVKLQKMKTDYNNLQLMKYKKKEIKSCYAQKLKKVKNIKKGIYMD